MILLLATVCRFYSFGVQTMFDNDKVMHMLTSSNLVGSIVVIWWQNEINYNEKLFSHQIPALFEL